MALRQAQLLVHSGIHLVLDIQLASLEEGVEGGEYLGDSIGAEDTQAVQLAVSSLDVCDQVRHAVTLCCCC